VNFIRFIQWCLKTTDVDLKNDKLALQRIFYHQPLLGHYLNLNVSQDIPDKSSQGGYAELFITQSNLRKKIIEILKPIHNQQNVMIQQLESANKSSSTTKWSTSVYSANWPVAWKLDNAIPDLEIFMPIIERLKMGRQLLKPMIEGLETYDSQPKKAWALLQKPCGYTTSALSDLGTTLQGYLILLCTSEYGKEANAELLKKIGVIHKKLRPVKNLLMSAYYAQWGFSRIYQQLNNPKNFPFAQIELQNTFKNMPHHGLKPNIRYNWEDAFNKLIPAVELSENKIKRLLNETLALLSKHDSSQTTLTNNLQLQINSLEEKYQRILFSLFELNKNGTALRFQVAPNTFTMVYLLSALVTQSNAAGKENILTQFFSLGPINHILNSDSKKIISYKNLADMFEVYIADQVNLQGQLTRYQKQLEQLSFQESKRRKHHMLFCIANMASYFKQPCETQQTDILEIFRAPYRKHDTFTCNPRLQNFSQLVDSQPIASDYLRYYFTKKIKTHTSPEDFFISAQQMLSAFKSLPHELDIHTKDAEKNAVACLNSLAHVNENSFSNWFKGDRGPALFFNAFFKYMHGTPQFTINIQKIFFERLALLFNHDQLSWKNKRASINSINNAPQKTLTWTRKLKKGTDDSRAWLLQKYNDINVFMIMERHRLESGEIKIADQTRANIFEALSIFTTKQWIDPEKLQQLDQFMSQKDWYSININPNLKKHKHSPSQTELLLHGYALMKHYEQQMLNPSFTKSAESFCNKRCLLAYLLNEILYGTLSSDKIRCVKEIGEDGYGGLSGRLKKFFVLIEKSATTGFINLLKKKSEPTNRSAYATKANGKFEEGNQDDIPFATKVAQSTSTTRRSLKKTFTAIEAIHKYLSSLEQNNLTSILHHLLFTHNQRLTNDSKGDSVFSRNIIAIALFKQTVKNYNIEAPEHLQQINKHRTKDHLPKAMIWAKTHITDSCYLAIKKILTPKTATNNFVSSGETLVVGEKVTGENALPDSLPVATEEDKQQPKKLNVYESIEPATDIMDDVRKHLASVPSRTQPQRGENALPDSHPPKPKEDTAEKPSINASPISNALDEQVDELIHRIEKLPKTIGSNATSGARLNSQPHKKPKSKPTTQEKEKQPIAVPG